MINCIHHFSYFDVNFAAATALTSSTPPPAGVLKNGPPRKRRFPNLMDYENLPVTRAKRRSTLPNKAVSETKLLHPSAASHFGESPTMFLGTSHNEELEFSFKPDYAHSVLIEPLSEPSASLFTSFSRSVLKAHIPTNAKLQENRNVT